MAISAPELAIAKKAVTDKIAAIEHLLTFCKTVKQ